MLFVFDRGLGRETIKHRSAASRRRYVQPCQNISIESGVATPHSDAFALQRLNSTGASRWPALIAVAAIVIAAVLAYSYFLSPRARVRGTVMEMARAFDQEDVNHIMDLVSKDYRDSSSLVRADLEDFLVFYFEERENIKVEIKSVRVILAGGQARAFVRGSLSYTTRAGKRRISINRPPMILRFKQETGVWRLVRAENANAFSEK